MKHLLAYSAVLSPALASGSSQFNVFDDLLQFPQYEVLWKQDAPVSKEYAQFQLSLNPTINPPTTPPTTDTELDQAPPVLLHSDNDSLPQSLVYQTLVRNGQPYLCSIPILPPAPPESSRPNKTAEEAKNELAQANKRGWDLLKGMEGNCLYLISGFWSYSFCYNDGVRQFHPLAPTRNVPPYPPLEDTSVAAYVLGIFDELEGKPQGNDDNRMGLANSGNARYLTRKLHGGTRCDITGEPRSIEVQFRCDPDPNDRISLIKETTICQYRMTISTPRLCNDLAFRPPKAAKPHPVACHPIYSPTTEAKQLQAKDEDAETAGEKKSPIIKTPGEILEMLQMTSKDVDVEDTTMEEIWGEAAASADPEAPSKDDKDLGDAKKKHIKVADIEVGGYNILAPGTKLKKGVAVGGGPEKYLGTVARSDGYVASDQDLAKLNVEKIQDLDDIRKEVMAQADGAGWHIDLIQTARGIEVRAFIGAPDDLEKDEGGEREEYEGEDEEWEEYEIETDGIEADGVVREEL